MFLVVFEQVQKFFVYMLIGLTLRKLSVVPKETAKVLSKLELNVFLPAVIFQSCCQNVTLEKLTENGRMMVIAFGVFFLMLFVGKIYSRFFVKDDYQKKVCLYTIAVPNTSYVGTPLVLALFGGEMLMKMLMFTLPLMIYTSTVGVRLLTNEDKISLRSMLSPPLFALLGGMLFGLLQIPMPKVVPLVLEGCGNCVAPVAMILTGCIIAEFSMKELLGKPMIYWITMLRMLIFPGLVLFGAKLLGADQGIMLMLLLVQTMPTGLNPVIFAATVDQDCTLGAGMAAVSHTVAVLTVPLLFQLFY